MSNPKSMAAAVALMASVSLLGLGCAMGAAEPGDDADQQAIVAGQGAQAGEGGQALGEESANVAGNDSKDGPTSESKDAMWGYGFGYPGFGFGYGAFGYPFYGYGYPLYGYGAFGYPAFGYGAFGYPFYGFGRRLWW